MDRMMMDGCLQHSRAWVTLIFFILGHCASVQANELNGYIGQGQCNIKVTKFTVQGSTARLILKHIAENNGHIVSTVRCTVPQESEAMCRMELEFICSAKARKHSVSFGTNFNYTNTFVTSPMCYQGGEKEPSPDPVRRPTIIRELNPDRNLYQDLPPQLQPGWLYQHLPRSLSDVINLEGLVNWFDGFMGEVLRALHEMKQMGGYWLEYLSGVLLKILILSVVAALVLLVTPASAVAGLAQLAAVALLIVSILGATGIEFDQGKLMPSWHSSAFMNVEFDVQNTLHQTNDGMLAGNVSVSYALMKGEKADQYKLYFASNRGRIDFYMQKNEQKTLEQTWQMPGAKDNRFNFADR